MAPPLFGAWLASLQMPLWGFMTMHVLVLIVLIVFPKPSLVFI